PSGPFIAGAIDETLNLPRVISLKDFWIYKNPVTVAQYRHFCSESHGKFKLPRPPAWGWSDHHPIVNVSWFEAQAYCLWAGVSLPVSDEWEKACRGTDGRRYPWGNDWNNRWWTDAHSLARSLPPIGSSPVNIYGLSDMIGSIMQWCEDPFKG